MITTLSSDDLLTRLTQEELAELTETDLETGQADPVETAIAGALGEITVFADPEAVEALSVDLLKRLWISLTIPLLYPRKAAVPEKHLKEQTWARDLLGRIAEGKTRNRTVELVTRDAAATESATRQSLRGL